MCETHVTVHKSPVDRESHLEPRVKTNFQIVARCPNLLMGGTVTDELARTSSVLVLAPDGVSATDDPSYMELLKEATGDRSPVLLVVFGESPDDRIDDVRLSIGTPEKLQVISVGEHARSATTAASQRTGPLTTVDRPDDLTDLGTRITETLDAWRDHEDVVVCLHSVTGMLGHASLEEVFRFLHVLINRLESGGATGFFHVDPDAHDSGTVVTLRPLFDSVCHQMDGELATARNLVDEYFGALLTEVAQSSPVSRSRLVTVMAQLHLAARARNLQGQADSDVVHRGTTEVVLALPADRWSALADDGPELRERHAAREVHQRMATALDASPDEIRDLFVYPY